MNPARENEVTDAVVIARVLQGDDHAFREIVLRYQGAVFACAQAITRNHADAADAAQEAFIRFHRHLVQYDPRRPLRPYLLRIAANCAHNVVARRLRAAEEPHQESAIEAIPDTASAPEAQALRQEQHAVIRSTVDRLPGRLREVCSLFYLADCACSEVAEILHMSETAVKVALHRAREKLRDGPLADWRVLQ